jgi:hypothetical protein
MRIITPIEIENIAWQGELDVLSSVTLDARSIKGIKKPMVTLGKSEIWNVADAMESVIGKKWIPPRGNANYWLIRLACTLRDPEGIYRIEEARMSISLSPKNKNANSDSAYAFSLHPDRLGVESKTEFSFKLSPELKFGETEAKAGEIGVDIEYRKVFPIIQSYGAGESEPSWTFRRHPTNPLDGSQFVYAVVVAMNEAGGIKAKMDFIAKAEVPVFGLPKEAKTKIEFMIP